LKSIARGIFVFNSLAILFALSLRAQETAPPEQAPQTVPPTGAATFEITGSVRSGKTPLPGVTVTAANTLSGKKYVAVSNSEGKFSFSGIPRGRYVVRVEFMGFASFTQEVVLNPDNVSAKVDAELILASRQQEQSNNKNAAIIAAGRGFQSLALDNTLASLAGNNPGLGGAGGLGGGQGGSDLSGLPMNGAGAEAVRTNYSNEFRSSASARNERALVVLAVAGASAAQVAGQSPLAGWGGDSTSINHMACSTSLTIRPA
jgi:hypothetical protein